MLRRGAQVEVFYRAWEDGDEQQDEWHAAAPPLASASAGSASASASARGEAQALLRLTAGWIAASVVEDFHPSVGGGGDADGRDGNQQ